MAFTETKGRYASYGTVSSIPGEIIDSFWFIIDNQLKALSRLSPLSILNYSTKKDCSL